jgi:UDP-N-acetylglucosamine acyltransferase
MAIDSSANVHPTALIHASAQLGPGVIVGPHSIIEANVTLGEGCVVGAFATISGPTRLGSGNRICNYATVGNDSQDLKFRGGETWLVMGDENVVREYVTINRASEAGGETRIGSHNLFMTSSHVAHNCILGDHIIMANVASLGGHVELEDHVILGGLVAVHQFCRVGAHAIVGAGAKVVQDIPPFCVADGIPARLAGTNRIGLGRRGFAPEEVESIKRAYVELFRRRGHLSRALEEFRAGDVDNEHLRHLIVFCAARRSGVAPARRRATSSPSSTPSP